MKLASFTAIVAALQDAGVRYLVAGGLAVNAYGYLRFTKVVDLVVELVPENIKSAFAAIRNLGYHPMVPVTAEQFADDSQRQSWIVDKGMTVLNFWSDLHKETPIDVFVSTPFDVVEAVPGTNPACPGGNGSPFKATPRRKLRKSSAPILHVTGRVQSAERWVNFRSRPPPPCAPVPPSLPMPGPL